MPRAVRILAAFVVGSAYLSVAGPTSGAAAMPQPPKTVDAWAWCGVSPDDPAARVAVKTMAQAGGIDATFGPCKPPPEGYTPDDPKDRYATPDVYMRLVVLNASVGMKTIVYDQRLWGTTQQRTDAISFWKPVFGDIAAWDMGDEFRPRIPATAVSPEVPYPTPEWTKLINRWTTMRNVVEPATGIAPFTNFVGNAESLNYALQDLPGVERLLSFDKYDEDKGVSLAQAFDPRARLMCAVNEYDHNGLQATPTSIRNDASALIAAGCDQILVFGGFPVYNDASKMFGTSSVVDWDGDATGRAPATQEGTGHSSLIPFGPIRLLETRSGPGLSTADSLFNAIGARPDDSVLELGIVGRAGMPAWARSVVLNVTITNARGPGYLTVYPCGEARPTSSNLNYVAGSTRAVAAVAQIGGNGAVCLYTQTSTDVVVDLTAFYPFGSSFSATAPSRLLDTRVGPEFPTIDGQLAGIGRRPGGTTTEIKVAGRGGVPSDAKAVSVNVTAVNSTQAGFITLYPCGGDVPLASTVNFTAGSIVANAATVQVGRNGSICLFSNVDTDAVLDLDGFDAASTVSVSFQPQRILETRPGLPTADGQFQTGATRPPDSVLQLQVGGRLGVPAAIRAALLNITVTDAASAGFVTVYPCSAVRPVASTLNYGAGATVANMALTPTTSDGKICIYTQTATNLAVDVSVYHL